MDPTPLTPHASARLQQRGIPRWVLDLLLDHGRARHDHHGAELISFPKPVRRRLRRVLPRERFAAIERHFDVYAVVAGDGALLTVGHRTKRMRAH